MRVDSYPLQSISPTIRHARCHLISGRATTLYLPYLLFAALGIAWIILSDRVLLGLNVSRDLIALTSFQTLKGIGFVLCTAGAFYYLHRRNKQALLDSTRSLESFGTIARASYDLIWRCAPSGQDYELLHASDVEKYLDIIEDPEGCVHPADRRGDMAGLVKGTGNKFEPYKTTTRLKVGGVYRYFETWVFPIFDRDGQLAEFFGTCRDVHEFVIAEQSLRRNEEMLRLAAEVGGVGIWEWDIPNNILEVSAETRRQYEADIHSPTDLKRFIHPDDYPEIRGAMLAAKSHCEPFDVQYRIITADQQLRWIHNKGAAVKGDKSGQKHMLGISQDITRLKQAESRLRQLAFYDPLTGLQNRQRGQDFLSHRLRDSEIDGNHVAVCLIDIDYFSSLNETYGPETGDRILLDTAQRLGTLCGPDDLLCRYGADVFLLVLCSSQPSDFLFRLEVLERQLADTLKIDDMRFFVSLSASYAQAPDDGSSANELLCAAQSAMYRAKHNSRGKLVRFSGNMLESSLRFEAIRNALKSAVSQHEFSVFYQPLYHLEDKQLAGFEALVRWTSETLGVVGPDEFIPIAERVGLIGDIDNFVLSEISHQISQWKTAGHDFKTVGFNLSPRNLEEEGCADVFHEKVEQLGLSPDELVLEVTETAMIHDAVTAASNIERLSGLGYALSIDDFGTGFSSLENLFRFTFKKIKIDKSFIQAITNSERHANLVRSVITMAYQLHMDVVAEGVETPDQLRLLREWGCDILQGYLYARPVPAAEAENYLRWRCVV